MVTCWRDSSSCVALQEALEHLPDSVEKRYASLGCVFYQPTICCGTATGTNKRFGIIDFAVGSDVTAEFRRAVAQVPEQDWKAAGMENIVGAWVPTGREWAEVPWRVPNDICGSQQRSRLIAIWRPAQS